MKKIGITTFYNAINYGAFLQCFALQELLNEKYDVHIIDYKNKKITKDYKLIKTNNIKRTLKSFFFIISNIIKKRKYSNCIRKFIKLSPIDDNYDVVIAGSDQIWNIELTGGVDEIFTLRKYKGIKKISYASSIGNENLIQKEANVYRNIIENIDYVSVREDSAKEELNKISEKNVVVTLDPTLTLSKEKWDKYTTESRIKEKYIFSYFVGVCQENYDALEKVSNKLGLKVLSYSENPKEKNKLKNCYADDPFEFITKIKYSDFVFTSSFHGTVFSIIFNKKFVCMLPKNKSNRILNLLEKLGLEDRIVRNIEDVVNFNYNKEIDYSKVNEKLEKLRTESINWLETAINK